MGEILTKEPNGILLVNKHEGVTSHDIVYKVRKLYGTQKVGHTGTLDPMATGLLIVLIGRSAKACEYVSSDTKRYLATLKLGLTTDTEDITGMVLTTNDVIPSEEDVKSVVSSFLGTQLQVPPMYSALKINGKKLCDLARKGVEVERNPREITVYDISFAKTEDKSEYLLDVTCSGGTYIRTLCADIGKQLGCGGVMKTLCRTETSGFSIQNAYTISDIQEMTEEKRKSILHPTECLFETLPKVNLPPFFEKLFRSGCEIYQKKIKTEYPIGIRLRIADEQGNFFALGEVADYPDGSAVKSIKLFQI